MQHYTDLVQYVSNLDSRKLVTVVAENPKRVKGRGFPVCRFFLHGADERSSCRDYFKKIYQC